FQPDIEANEKITASHLFNFQLRCSGATRVPGNRNGDPGISTNDGFQRNFYRHVKVRRDQRPTTIDNFFAISFKRVGRVVEPYAKQHPYEMVRQPIEKQFNFGITNYAATANEAATKHTVITFVQFLPVTHNVTAVVRLVSHHDDNRITGHTVETTVNGATESMLPAVLHWYQAGNLCLKRFERASSCIGAAIVNNNDLMRHIVAPKFEVEMLDRRCDAGLFISSWDNDREQLQRCRIQRRTTHTARQYFELFRMSLRISGISPAFLIVTSILRNDSSRKAQCSRFLHRREGSPIMVF